MASPPSLAGRLGRDAETIVSTNEKFQRKTVFLDLPIDIFLKLLDWLEISDVFNLRSVSMSGAERFDSATLDLGEAYGLSCDWEESSLAAMGSSSHRRTFANSGTPHASGSKDADALGCCRWLVIQQNATTLEFWDLEDLKSEKPALSIDSLNGIVDGSVVWSRGKSTGIMMISTRSCEAGRIEFALPYPKAEDGPVSARVVDSFTEFSRLMDGDEHIAAFLHYKGNRGNFIRSISTGSIIRLDPVPEYSKETQPQQAFGIQIKRNVVAVATAWSVDLYWRDTIITSLQEAEAELSIQPFQRLSYLGGSVSEGPQELTTDSAFFLAYNPKFLSLPPDDDAIFLCVGKDSGRHLYVAQPVNDNHTSPSTYRLFHEIGLFWSDPYSMLFYESGESGRRSVFIVDEPRGLSLCGISIPADLSQHAEGSSERGRIGRWRITDSSSKDLIHHVVFEEATGACAVAMGSGRVWIADLTASEIIPQNYGGHIDSPVSNFSTRVSV
ncbi:hypothetical protein FRC04_000714 [Tulasnella sp. 424]|nr:hypothetical protein FRC04_000714 [Tulasnella sp. 424]